MFTKNEIPLSAIVNRLNFDIEILRDFYFSYIGKIPSRVSPRLVPCGTSVHIRDAIAQKGISGIITTAELAAQVPENIGVAISINPIFSAYLIHEFLCELQDFHWISFPSKISNSAKIHSSAVIAERDVIIGDNCVVHPNAIIYQRSIIGNNSTVGAGTVIGCDGFEVNTTKDRYEILKQAGGVKIGEHVDIQAKCTIVRSTFGGFTEIGDETKFDCQVHLAHDCQVGRRVQIAACAEISGRVTVGDNAYLGPNVTVSNGIFIGAGAYITLGSVVTRDVVANGHVSGNFAVEHSKWINLMRKVR